MIVAIYLKSHDVNSFKMYGTIMHNSVLITS